MRPAPPPACSSPPQPHPKPHAAPPLQPTNLPTCQPTNPPTKPNRQIALDYALESLDALFLHLEHSWHLFAFKTLDGRTCKEAAPDAAWDEAVNAMEPLMPRQAAAFCTEMEIEEARATRLWAAQGEVHARAASDPSEFVVQAEAVAELQERLRVWTTLHVYGILVWRTCMFDVRQYLASVAAIQPRFPMMVGWCFAFDRRRRAAAGAKEAGAAAAGAGKVKGRAAAVEVAAAAAGAAAAQGPPGVAGAPAAVSN